jgi:DNA-directed RNA polymerase specialized sigma24 family protein
MQSHPVTMNYTTLNASTLAERSRAGDADAFAELYHRYLTPVYRFIFRRVGGDVAAAEDLTFQVFLEAFDLYIARFIGKWDTDWEREIILGKSSRR